MAEAPTPHDAAHLARAVALGRSVRRLTAPNPPVGCVIVRDGRVVGEGATEAPGGRHAEIVALDGAGADARGGTAYVTLEPCAHHGRTPPCTDALVRAGVARVVYGEGDPDPAVAGRGVAELRAAGIAVEREPGSDAARDLAAYLHHRRTGRSFCVLKAAASIDGRITAADGTSQWITGPIARADGHDLRADSQAVVVGAGTALADRPALTVRDTLVPGIASGAAPLRVLLDARGRVPAEGPLFDGSVGTLVVTTERCPGERVDEWRARGAEIATVGFAGVPGSQGVDLEATLALLGARGVLQAMVEGGSLLHRAFIAAGLADQLVLYTGNTLLGAQGAPVFGGGGPSTIAAAGRFRLLGARVLGDDVRLDYEPITEEAA